MIDIKKIALDIGVCEDLIQEHSDSHISVLGSPLFGITIHFEEVDSSIMYYFAIKTSSWCYGGERSDIHDVIGVCLAAFLKSEESKFSLLIVDEEHPFCDNEIFIRYLIPEDYNVIDSDTATAVQSIICLTDFFANILKLAICGVGDLPKSFTCEIHKLEMGIMFKCNESF